MCAFAAHLGVAHEDIDDVVQDASIRIWRYAQTFKGGSTWLTWALSVVRHTSIDRWRSESRRREVESAAAQPDVALPGDVLDALTREERAWVEAWLAGEAPGTDRTQRRRLGKIKARLTADRQS
jgi:RNA polymerase sigma factor (sigma-70 family)